MHLEGSTLPLPFPHPSRHRTWSDAVDRWVREGAWKSGRTVELERHALAWLSRHLLDQDLAGISAERVDELVDQISRSGLKPSTANRFLSVLRAVLNSAVAWHWLGHAPRVHQLKDRAKRVRFITWREAQRLLIQLPPHLATLAAFSLETGLRRSNVTGLTWQQVDVDRRVAWIHADQAKGRRSIPVPLSPAAVRILERCDGDHAEFVFTYRGRPVRQTSTKAWRSALDRAGIKNFRWHDLRHTWASWHAQAGTPLHVLQELGGWRSPRMVQHYAHLSTEHLHGYVDRMHDSLRRSDSVKSLIIRRTA